MRFLDRLPPDLRSLSFAICFLSVIGAAWEAWSNFLSIFSYLFYLMKSFYSELTTALRTSLEDRGDARPLEAPEPASYWLLASLDLWWLFSIYLLGEVFDEGETEGLGDLGLLEGVVDFIWLNLDTFGSTYGLPDRYLKLVVSSRCLMNSLSPG